MKKFRISIYVLLFINIHLLSPIHAQPTVTSIPYGNNINVGRFFQADGATIYYEIYGEGAPLVLIHGNGGNIAYMKPQIEYFSRKYKVIVMDCRGRGKSELGNDSLTYIGMTRDIAGILNYLHLDSAYVVGRSDGGIISLLLAINYPEKVKKVAAFAANLTPDTSALYSAFYFEVIKERKHADEMIAQGDTRQNWKVIQQRNRLMEFQPHITAGDLDKIKCPVLVMSTDRDIIPIEHTMFIYRHIEKANLCIFTGEDHYVTSNNPELFNAAVDKFFKMAVQHADNLAAINIAAGKIEPQVIAWRHDFHQHPELGNSELRTSAMVARHLQSLGIEVKTGVAHTGVVGILRGDYPGPVVALRADMDALPVEEKNGLPYASKVKTTFNGQETFVMHACGHDAHTAILMGVAEILAGIKKELHGTVKFIFQPAEEGAPKGEEGGAELMVKEGVLENPKVDVIFGLHMDALKEAGVITYRPGGTFASGSDMKITVKGKPSHGAQPWSSVDPIVVSSQIITSLQTIVSRNVNLTENAAVVTIGSIHGGIRQNIIPAEVEMLGTVRTLSDADEKLVYSRVHQAVEKTAEAAGATAMVELPYSVHYPVTFNNEALTAAMLPSLQKSAGAENVKLVAATTGSEDFSYYAQKVPGLFFRIGGMQKGKDPKTAGPHHTPEFLIEDSSFKTGVIAFCNLVLDYMDMNIK